MPKYLQNKEPTRLFINRKWVSQQKVYSNGWEAITREKLDDRIILKFIHFDANYLQTIMKHVKTNIRKIAIRVSMLHLRNNYLRLNDCIFKVFK